MVLSKRLLSDDPVTLRCAGRIVRGEEASVLCAALQQYGRNVVLDLSQVDGIDAVGVGALIALQAAGVYLRLKDPSKVVRQALEQIGASALFEIWESSNSFPRSSIESEPAAA